MNELEIVLKLIETNLEHERGYTAVYALKGNTAQMEKHRYANLLLEQLRKDFNDLQKK